jgi:PEP-CTERM motif
MKHRAPSLKSSIAIALLSALWVASPAGAVPITDTVDPADTTITSGSTPAPCPIGFSCSPSALSFIHDITDNGFIVGSDIISSATLYIHLTDPAGGGAESYTFSIGSAQTVNSNNVPSGGGGSIDTITFTVPSLADLQLDGKIGVEVTSTSGSFMFADSLLTVQVGTNSAFEIAQNEVPVPSTLLLLGAGLATFGWRSRRQS